MERASLAAGPDALLPAVSKADAAGLELWTCAQQGHVAQVVEKAARCRDNDVWKAAVVAVCNDEVEAVAALLRKKPALVSAATSRVGTLLHCAAFHGSIEAAKVLLRAGASLNVHSDLHGTAVAKAAEAGHAPMVELLLLNSADVKKAHAGVHTPLSIAAKHGHLDVLQTLLAAKVSANLCTPFGQPPLWWSIRCNWPAATQLLVDANANVNGAGTFSPVGSAATFNHVHVLRALVSAKADVDATDCCGDTPLADAADNGREGAVKVLLEARANVNRRARLGRTPIFLAARGNFAHVLWQLVSAKADVDIADNLGITPLQVAEQRGYSATVRVLRDLP